MKFITLNFFYLYEHILIQLHFIVYFVGLLVFKLIIGQDIYLGNGRQ